MLGRIISKICPFFMVTNNNPVSEKKYLNSGYNDINIYNENQTKSIIPVIKLEGSNSKLKQLCLVDFKGDEIYKCLELQQILQGDELHYVILSYRNDNEMDIYYTKGFEASEENYRSLLNKVTLYELDSIQVQFTMDEKGVDYYLAFRDKNNRSIEIKIRENKKKNDYFGLIAPVGNTSENPDKFPLIYMKKFNMVQMKGTTIYVKIDGKEEQLLKLLPFCNFKKVYFARYSVFNNIKDLNPNYCGSLQNVKVNDGDMEIKVGKCDYSIHWNHEYPEIKEVKCVESDTEMGIRFSPPIPDFVSLKNDTMILGHFSVYVDEITGIAGGNYTVKKNGSLVQIKINPQKGWQPMPGKLWLKTYLWNCDITLEKGSCQMVSKWIRTGMNQSYDKIAK